MRSPASRLKHIFECRRAYWRDPDAARAKGRAYYHEHKDEIKARAAHRAEQTQRRMEELAAEVIRLEGERRNLMYGGRGR